MGDNFNKGIVVKYRVEQTILCPTDKVYNDPEVFVPFHTWTFYS